jgi:hypothetical protein
MGACSSTQATSLIIILAQLHHIKLWGLDFFLYFTKKTTLQTQHNHYLSILQNNILSMGALSLLLFFDSWYNFQRCSRSFGVLFIVKDGG